MKPHPGTLLVILLGFFCVASRLAAQSASMETSLPESAGFSVPATTDNIHWETVRLIHQDAQKLKLKHAPVDGDKVAEKSPDMLILDRLVVTKRPPETLPPPVIETPVQQFFRTGTIAEHVGSKVTTHFWLHPELGLRLSFEF